ncbi:uncharacterized protein LOC131213888 [Anopheles bellator]|uniref:uncharacterized protein LOC131213888 n=1 Tax=Anopheles bellator TaxID=139047 RepID=UPI002648D3A3|nr:uncharacterized protein LOC131213888 [Anopheles bellator]XP_058064082.1 uncharacterized protein LOC131213888 [Anopheles bellator]
MVASEQEEDIAPKRETTAAPAPTSAADNVNESEISKRTFRLEVWSKMRSEKRSQSAGPSNNSTRKIPFFPEAEQAAERLAETDEFKQASKIKVNIDLVQESVKLQVLKAHKTLFVAPSQKSEFLYAKIKSCNVNEVPLTIQKRIVKMLGPEDTYEELGIDQAEPVDMVVVGCVAVSEQGQRIGKGNGYVDLEIALLAEQGVITPKTVIATTVADAQVYDVLPEELFQPYDFTIDLIVTPTRVIRVANRPTPRVIGIQWGLLSARRLEVVRVLKKLKEQLEAQGKVIALKDEDTDVESFRKPRNQRSGGGSGQRRQQTRRRRSVRNQQNGAADTGAGAAIRSHDEGGKEGAEKRTGEEGGGGGRRARRKPRYGRKVRNYSDSDSSQGRDGGVVGKSESASGGGGGRGKRHRGISGRSGGGQLEENEQFANGAGGKSGRNRSGKAGGTGNGRPRGRVLQHQDSVRIRVSNMFAVRFKDFKEELRFRDCYPSKISKGRYGKCMLIFPKRDNTDEQSQAEELLSKLSDMRITVQQKDGEAKQVELKCELHQRRRDGSTSDHDVENHESQQEQQGQQDQYAPHGQQREQAQQPSPHSEGGQKVS